MMKEVPNNIVVVNLSYCTVFFVIKRTFASLILWVELLIKPKPL